MQVDFDAPLHFLKAAFLPDDWVAVLLKRADTGEAAQRVGPVAMVLDERYQSWLRSKNARRFNVFVSVNAITPGRRSRTRDAIRAVRHVFLDADRDADSVLSAIADRSNLPRPSYVLRSSKGRAHVLWRVEGFSIERAEALQKDLAKQLGTDVAAISAAQMTRLPGFLNQKYTPPQPVTVAYASPLPLLRHASFPEASIPSVPKGPLIALPRRTPVPIISRARSYLAATPPAVAGEHGDAHTFAVCCRLSTHFDLSEQDALTLLIAWNQRCEPPWTIRDLADKLRRAREYR